jgi:YHS domain-containing protein
MKSLIIFSSLFILGIITLPYENALAEFRQSSDTSIVCIVDAEKFSGSGVSLRYIDKDISLCSEGCEMAFKKEPSKFMSEGLKCMPCGEDDANKEISHVHNGVKYYFCGKGCKGKFENDPQKYLDKYNEK